MGRSIRITLTYPFISCSIVNKQNKKTLREKSNLAIFQKGDLP